MAPRYFTVLDSMIYQKIKYFIHFIVTNNQSPNPIGSVEKLPRLAMSKQAGSYLWKHLKKKKNNLETGL